ncbi:DUF3597 domain-containing protein [Qipengyuania nanhaisediminis]|uniref:DUF3597 domain-containing protein n=1 Tax=Qipengyuania nanhaisediminis TaxID=604088 RepID=UPI0038B3656F
MMGIFSSISEAIFGKDEDDKPKPTEGTPRAKATTGPRARAAISRDEVERRIANIPGADKLNWKTSIVDLMKLVKIDPSYDNRKQLARELGNADYSGSAEDNIKLHDQVIDQIAKSGGVVPAHLKD